MTARAILEAAAALKAARIAAGYTWNQAAAAIGVHRSVIYKHETGDQHSPRIIVAMGDLYGLSAEEVDDLFAATGQIAPDIADRWINDQEYRRAMRAF